MKKTVLLIDDHAIMREGIAKILEISSDLCVTGETGDGARAVQIAREENPDLVVMDLLVPGLDAATTIRTIRTVSPRTRIVILTSTCDEELAFSAIEAGADSYLLKSISSDALLNALRSIVAGVPVIHPTITRQILLAVRSKRERVIDPFSSLTEREREVLRALAEGASNSRIAKSLEITEHTVKTHISNVLSKLQLTDRTEAVAYAWRQGLLGPGQGR